LVTSDSSRAAWLRQARSYLRNADLALRKAVQAVYQLGHLPAEQEVLAIAEKWRPYRSLATSYLFSAAFEPAGPPPAAGNRSA
jgi:3-methyladenine DNA glycosylase/8-oxoguanine DNA glycosylase